MTKVNKTIAATAAAIAVAPALAFAAPSIGDSLGIDMEQVLSSLNDAGYEVREFEVEDDELEAVIFVDGQLFEVEISPETGMVTGIELEELDDDDVDDDDMAN